MLNWRIIATYSYSPLTSPKFVLMINIFHYLSKTAHENSVIIIFYITKVAISFAFTWNDNDLEFLVFFFLFLCQWRPWFRTLPKQEQPRLLLYNLLIPSENGFRHFEEQLKLQKKKKKKSYVSFVQRSVKIIQTSNFFITMNYSLFIYPSTYLFCLPIYLIILLVVRVSYQGVFACLAGECYSYK